MSIDYERPITFNEASRFLPAGSRPSSATWWRWWRRGVKGVHLHTILCGGRRYTTASAVIEFFERVTAAAAGENAPIRTSRQRERAVAAAEAEMGIVAPSLVEEEKG